MAHTSYKRSIAQVELDATAIGGLVRGSARSGINVDREGSGSDPYARHQTIVERKTVATWESYALKSWLSAVGLAGKKIDSLATGLKYYLTKSEHGSTRATGSNHDKYTIVSGLILPRRLQCRHRQKATISYDALATYDQSNPVISMTPGVALPSAFADDERFGLGPIVLDSDTYDGKVDIELDFGLQEDALGADGDVDDTEASIAAVLPEFRIRGIKPSWFHADLVPLDGLALGHSAADIYFRRYKKGGKGFEADGQAKHIKMTIAGIAYLETFFEGDHNRAAECQLRIPLEHDGTNLPVLITVDSTIT